MNILVDKLPVTVEIGGGNYAVNTDFRVFLLFEMLMLDDDAEGGDKLPLALRLVFPVLPEDWGAATDAMLWLYQGGRDAPQKDDSAGEAAERIYSYEQDDGYIYAAFLEQYGIDLQDVPFLHWWKFKALFLGLKADCQIVKIMGYRAMTIDNNLPDAQKDFYRKMKQLYALPRPACEMEKNAAIEEALLNGGDLSALFE